jgi:hypothetical protein
MKLTVAEVMEVLGVTSPDTIRNWLQGGAFPGAEKAPDGHWYFPLEDVETVKIRMEWVREKNSKGDLELPDDLDEGSEPPLL